MKPFLTVMLSIAAIYGLYKYLGRKTTPPDWEPMNTKEDASDNMFV